MSDLNEISSKLWAMANELRGNMDAAEYINLIQKLSASSSTTGLRKHL